MSLVVTEDPYYGEVELSHLYSSQPFGVCGVIASTTVPIPNRCSEDGIDLHDNVLYHLVHYWLESVDISNSDDIRLKLIEEIKTATIESGWNYLNNGNSRRIQLGGSHPPVPESDRVTRYQIAKEE